MQYFHNSQINQKYLFSSSFEAAPFPISQRIRSLCFFGLSQLHRHDSPNLLRPKLDFPPSKPLSMQNSNTSAQFRQLIYFLSCSFSPKCWRNIHPCTETSRSFPYIPASALTFLWKTPRILSFNTLHTLQYITFSTVLMHHFIFTDNSEKTCFPPEFEHSPFPKPSLSLHCRSILCSYELSQLPRQDILKLLRPPSDFQVSTPLKSHCISW